MISNVKILSCDGIINEIEEEIERIKIKIQQEKYELEKENLKFDLKRLKLFLQNLKGARKNLSSCGEGSLYIQNVMIKNMKFINCDFSEAKEIEIENSFL